MQVDDGTLVFGGHFDAVEHEEPLSTDCRILSCTWPCRGTMKRLLDLLATLPKFKWAVVSKEKSKEKKTSHFHVHLVFWMKVHISWKTLDDLYGAHGHYQAVRKTPLRHLNYVVKEGLYEFRSYPDAAGFAKTEMLESIRACREDVIHEPVPDPISDVAKIRYDVQAQAFEWFLKGRK